MPAPPVPAATDSIRLPELDGVRGIAIALVVVFHYFTNPVAESAGQGLRYLQLAGYLGWTGVDLFFVLSGFLIGGILMDHRESGNYFRVFYLRRACRILPLYAVVLGLFGLLLLTTPGWGGRLYRGGTDFIHYVLFLQNWFINEMPGYGPVIASVTWSLAIEEQFYLLVPLLIRFLPAGPLLMVTAALILLAPMAREWAGSMGNITYTFCRGDSLMTGVLIAWLVRHRLPLLRRLLPALVPAFLILLVAMAWLTLGWVPNGDPLGHLVFAAFYGTGLLLVVLSAGHVLVSPLRWSWLTWLGRRSYGIYLFHLPIYLVVTESLGRRMTIRDPADLYYPVIALAISLLLVELAFRWIEAPVIRIGHRSRYD